MLAKTFILNGALKMGIYVHLNFECIGMKLLRVVHELFRELAIVTIKSENETRRKYI